MGRAMEQTFTASLFYRDPKAALDWLAKAFGFEVTFVVTDEEGNLGHSSMNYGGGEITVNGEWSDPNAVGDARMVSPATQGGANTQFMRVRLVEDIHAHCARAKAAGAHITLEPQDQFYGDCVYRALDPEGHVWNFCQAIPTVSDDAKARGAQWTVRQAFKS